MLKLVTKPNPTNTQGLRALGGWVLCVVLSVAVFFAQSMPMNASVVSHGGNWIEICGGEDGSYFIQLEDGAPQPGPLDCDHCDDCLLMANTLSVNATPEWAALAPFGFGTLSFDLAQTVGLAGAEQYWSACRGPPLEKSGNRMPTPFILASLAHDPAISDTWSNPWT